MPVLRIDTKISSVDHRVQVPCDHTIEVSVSMYNLQIISEKKSMIDTRTFFKEIRMYLVGGKIYLHNPNCRQEYTDSAVLTGL